MRKKRLITSIVIALILLSFTLYAQENTSVEIPEKVQEIIPGKVKYSVEEASKIQGLSVDDIDLPEAIRKVLEQQSDYYKEIQLKEEERKKQESINTIVKVTEIGVVFLIIFIIIFLLLNKNMYKSIRRNIRRVFLYHFIKDYLKQGKSFKDIETILIRNGFDDMHVEDAIIRYKKNMKGVIKK